MNATKKAAEQYRDEHALDAIENGAQDIVDLGDEMRSWYDNMPDNFQQADRGERVEEAASTIENCNIESSKDDVVEALEKCKETSGSGLEGFDAELAKLNLRRRAPKRRQSRRDRLDDAIGGIRLACEAIVEMVEGNALWTATDRGKDVVDACHELESQCDELDGVEFPGMYG